MWVPTNDVPASTNAATSSPDTDIPRSPGVASSIEEIGESVLDLHEGRGRVQVKGVLRACGGVGKQRDRGWAALALRVQSHVFLCSLLVPRPRTVGDDDYDTTLSEIGTGPCKHNTRHHRGDVWVCVKHARTVSVAFRLHL